MSAGKSVAIGKKVPQLSGTTDAGTPLDLASFRGKWIVIYFYPRDSTPGCTTEAGDFRDLYSKFRRLNCEILGVSRDSVASHARFRAKQQLPFALIADTDEMATSEPPSPRSTRCRAASRRQRNTPSRFTDCTRRHSA